MTVLDIFFWITWQLAHKKWSHKPSEYCDLAAVNRYYGIYDGRSTLVCFFLPSVQIKHILNCCFICPVWKIKKSTHNSFLKLFPLFVVSEIFHPVADCFDLQVSYIGPKQNVLSLYSQDFWLVKLHNQTRLNMPQLKETSHFRNVYWKKHDFDELKL